MNLIVLKFSGARPRIAIAFGRRWEAPLHNLDFSSWQSLLATLIGLALFTLLGVGIRLLAMFHDPAASRTHEPQINERLRTLIAAYKTLGGSFTGNLAVDPAHLRDLRRSSEPGIEGEVMIEGASDRTARGVSAMRSRRRCRTLSCWGPRSMSAWPSARARELIAGRPVHMHELVVSLRTFIREALDLDPIPSDLAIPMQGPARPSNSGGRGKNERGKDDSRQGGGAAMGAGMGAGMGGGMAPGGGAGLGGSGDADDPSSPDHHA